MTKYSAPLILAISLLSIDAQADALGLFIGGGIWDHDATGTFGTIGDNTLNMESDLNYKSENDTYIWAAFDHFVPLVPNIRVEASTIGHEGTAAGLFDFGNGNNLTGTSSLSIDTTDAILYYRLLDNWINFDFGLTVRQLDGEFKLATETISISETIPMLYVAAQFDLPFTGFSVGGDINVISYSDNTYQDIRLRAIYEMGIIAFEAGLKTTTIELDNVDNINADLEFKGLMLGAFLHF